MWSPETGFQADCCRYPCCCSKADVAQPCLSGGCQVGRDPTARRTHAAHANHTMIQHNNHNNVRTGRPWPDISHKWSFPWSRTDWSFPDGFKYLLPVLFLVADLLPVLFLVAEVPTIGECSQDRSLDSSWKCCSNLWRSLLMSARRTWQTWMRG